MVASPTVVFLNSGGNDISVDGGGWVDGWMGGWVDEWMSELRVESQCFYCERIIKNHPRQNAARPVKEKSRLIAKVHDSVSASLGS
jgi:hypothetical protein